MPPTYGPEPWEKTYGRATASDQLSPVSTWKSVYSERKKLP